MGDTDIKLSRISKVLIDREELTVGEALVRRQRYGVILRCGADVAQSYTLQLAVLTAANIAKRCFPGAVHVVLEAQLTDAPFLVWPALNSTLGQELARLIGPDALIGASSKVPAGREIVFGGAEAAAGALRVTFDGWIAKVGPADAVARLQEREYCSLAGILGASLAISELFLSFAEISLEAGRRTVGISLWRPDLDIADPEAIGRRVEFLPSELWALGLGHLGNAYLWAIASLPYADRGAVEIYLNDFDKVEPENVETGLIFDSEQNSRYKTRVCGAWLERRGFRTRLVERRFDSNFRCRPDEPMLALCGFDSNPVRRDMATAEFLKVIESGLGGTTNNFDTINMHTLPNPRPPAELWPDLPRDEEEKQRLRLEDAARKNVAYSGLANDECGRFELAGKAVSVPFVGTTAATLVVSEILRLLHEGPAYTDIKLVLSVIERRALRRARDYGAQDFVGLKSASAQ